MEPVQDSKDQYIQLSLATERNKKRNVWKRSKVESQDEINKS